MTPERVLELLKIERECINRNNQPFGMNCNRECGKCDLLQDTDELLEMYDYLINLMNRFTQKINVVRGNELLKERIREIYEREGCNQNRIDNI